MADAHWTVRVLLVEDSPSQAAIVMDWLSEGHVSTTYEVTHAASMAAATELLNNTENKFDIVLEDLTLPDSEGMQTIETILSNTPQTAVVIMTSIDDESMAIDAVSQGVTDYLVKGQVNKVLLVRTIRHAMERHRILVEERKLESVRTELTPENQVFQMDGPIAFRLELLMEDTAEGELTYDAHQACVNNSLTIKDPTGKLVPYVDGPYPVLSAPKPIAPGERKVLFDGFDLSSQYEIKEAGKYTVQFNGRGLLIGDMAGILDRAMWSMTSQSLASNITNIHISD